MIHRTKTFNRLEDLAAFLNRNPLVELIATTPTKQGVVALLRDRLAPDKGSTSEVFQRKLRELQDSEDRTFARFLNSVRNLKRFEGNTLAEIREFALDWLKTQSNVRLGNAKPLTIFFLKP